MDKKYVEVLVTRYNGGEEEILLIQKDRPAWQKGKLNLPGGGIEEGETPEQAIVREVKEETGLDLVYVHDRGLIKDRHLIVHCLHGSVTRPFDPFKPREGETEVPIWLPMQRVMTDPRLIPNLRTIIPMLRCGVDGWVLTDDATSTGDKGGHTFSVTVPTYR